MSLTTTPTGPTPAEVEGLLVGLRQMATDARTDEEIRQVTSRIAQITRAFRIKHGIGMPEHPAEQGRELDPKYRIRPHIDYLSQRIARAVRDVEQGHNRQIAVSMPPRMGKSTLLSMYGPLWILRRHPEWPIINASHDGVLAASWARNVRRLIEDHPDLGVALARDGGAGSRWETIESGGIYTTSTKGGLTGRGARVMVIDDPVRDFVDAHSLVLRQTLWDWWLSVAQTRLEPPYLVIVVMTRWHEDDMIGRLFSEDNEGDPASWEKISLSAIADTADDVLGRVEGEPLFSPLLSEDRNAAIDRWMDVRRSVGTYTFSAMYQQRPAPAKGAIFDSGWWRFWTSDPEKATEDGRIVYLDPSSLTGGRWLDSWDLNFESDEQTFGGWVVGQRWVRSLANRFLIAQQRGRWSFTQTIAAMERWAVTDDPFASRCGNLVHQRLVEKKANGAAAINVLRNRISGLKPINPTASKVVRARSVTPECESGNVFLPHPSDPGNEWVADLLSELRNFPHDVSDDQVDALSQALTELREAGKGKATVPGQVQAGRPTLQVPRNIAAAAMSDLGRPRGANGSNGYHR